MRMKLVIWSGYSSLYVFSLLRVEQLGLMKSLQRKAFTPPIRRRSDHFRSLCESAALVAVKLATVLKFMNKACELMELMRLELFNAISQLSPEREGKLSSLFYYNSRQIKRGPKATYRSAGASAAHHLY